MTAGVHPNDRQKATKEHHHRREVSGTTREIRPVRARIEATGVLPRRNDRLPDREAVLPGVSRPVATGAENHQVPGPEVIRKAPLPADHRAAEKVPERSRDLREKARALLRRQNPPAVPRKGLRVRVDPPRKSRQEVRKDNGSF